MGEREFHFRSHTPVPGLKKRSIHKSMLFVIVFGLPFPKIGDGDGDGDGGDGGRESNIIWKSKVRCQKISKRFYVCIEIFGHILAKEKYIGKEN